MNFTEEELPEVIEIIKSMVKKEYIKTAPFLAPFANKPGARNYYIDFRFYRTYRGRKTLTDQERLEDPDYQAISQSLNQRRGRLNDTLVGEQWLLRWLESLSKIERDKFERDNREDLELYRETKKTIQRVFERAEEIGIDLERFKSQ